MMGRQEGGAWGVTLSEVRAADKTGLAWTLAGQWPRAGPRLERERPRELPGTG